MKLTIKDLEENLPFYLLFKYSLDPLAVLDKEGQIVMVNEALCEWFGYTEKEFLKLHFANVTHQDYIMADLSEFTDLIHDKIKSYGFRKVWIHKLGYELHGKLKAIAVKHPRDKGEKWNYVFGLINPDQEVKSLKETPARNQGEISPWSALMNDPGFKRFQIAVGKRIVAVLVAIILGLLGFKNWEAILALLGLGG